MACATPSSVAFVFRNDAFAPIRPRKPLKSVGTSKSMRSFRHSVRAKLGPPSLQYRRLGDSDLHISEVALGTMTFGEQNTEKKAHELLSYAFENGINILDTAEAYSSPMKKETQGKLDIYIGSWLKSRPRDKVILATKVCGYSERSSYVHANTKLLRVDAANIKESVEKSLKRLGTDYIDLLQIHWFCKTQPVPFRLVCKASSAASGSFRADSDENPYEVLGVNPIAGFDTIKVTYTRKLKDAQRRGDEGLAAQLERAYDKITMAQLKNRKEGVTFGSFQVSKDIKYADKQPIVPWFPRFTKSSVQDMRINFAIFAVFTSWVAVKKNAEWKPLQFLAFVFVYRVFVKLKAFEPPLSATYTEDGEDDGRALRMGKRLLRSLALVFGCIAVTSLELLVTSFSAALLYITASYYR